MLSVPVHPPASVTVTTYVVVAAGVAVGLFTVVELNPAAGLHLYEYGAVPPVADALIAATALQQGLRLLTGNAKHYGVIPGLDVMKFKA